MHAFKLPQHPLAPSFAHLSPRMWCVAPVWRFVHASILTLCCAQLEKGDYPIARFLSVFERVVALHVLVRFVFFLIHPFLTTRAFDRFCAGCLMS